MSKIMGGIKLSPREITELCFEVMPLGIPVAVQGPPGSSKSSIGMSLADTFSQRTGVQHHTKVLNAALCEPTEVAGLPYVSRESGESTMEIARSYFWPDRENTIVVIEEPTKGPKLIQNALGEAILEKRVGRYQLPKNTMFYLSWNRRSDGAGDERLLSHFVNRQCLVDIEINAQEHFSYAMAKGWNAFVLAYLKQMPQKLFEDEIFQKEGRYNPENPCFPSPRSWEKVSQVMSRENLSQKVKMAAVQGLIGQGPMQEFFSWYNVSKDMPDLDLCINSPKTAPLPKEMSVMYALVVALALRSNKDTLKNILEYVRRLRREYQVLWAKSVGDRSPELVAASPDIRQWITSVSDIIQ